MNNTWEQLYSVIKASGRETVVHENRLGDIDNAFSKLQISDKSVLGAIISNTCGITVDNWIRILGSGSKNNRGILSYNEIGDDGIPKKVEGMLIVADDVVGGTFAINNGKYSTGIGEIWYFAPDTLKWESMEVKHSEFIMWVLQGDIDGFYKSMRWKKWKKDCKEVGFNQAMLIYPFLWSNEIKLEKATKKAVPVEELFEINQEYSKKFKLS